MFNLTYSTAFTWRDIFIILSWEKFDRYLVEMEFPLTSDILIIRPVAREFVQRYFDIQSQQYQSNKVIKQVQQLFDETYQVLEVKLGKTKTKALYGWGNQLHIDQRQVYALGLIVDTMFRIISEKKPSSRMKSTSLSTASQDLVQSLLHRYKDETRNIRDSLDITNQEASQDEWGKTILQGYKNPDFADGTKDDTPVSPTDHLDTWISYLKARSILHTMKGSLSQEELETLNDLLRTHPNWVKAQSRLSSTDYQPLDLLEVTEH